MSQEPPAFSADEIRFAHGDGLTRKSVFLGGKLGTVVTTAVAAPDALERIHNRGGITADQHDAACRWAHDYERAGMATAVCATYGGAVAVGVEAEPEQRRAAKERFRRGYDAMRGRGASVVWGVVVDNRPLSDWPWSVTYTSERFREALDELANFYG